MRALNRETLKGLWAAVPTPWTPTGNLDEGVVQRNCERLAAAGVDGIYTTDSDGEFYGIEINNFRTLARVFGRAMTSVGKDAAMGVTWSHTEGVIERIEASRDAGIPNVHVAFPFWMPLARRDVDRFFEDLITAVPEVRLIHYAHPSTGPELTGVDYARLADTFPEAFIGTKLGTSDFSKLSEILIHSPRLAHFVVDPTMLPGILLGAKGCYSYWVNTLPGWHRKFMDDCLQGNYEEAATKHRQLLRWEFDHVKETARRWSPARHYR